MKTLFEKASHAANSMLGRVALAAMLSTGLSSFNANAQNLAAPAAADAATTSTVVRPNSYPFHFKDGRTHEDENGQTISGMSVIDARKFATRASEKNVVLVVHSNNPLEVQNAIKAVLGVYVAMPNVGLVLSDANNSDQYNWIVYADGKPRANGYTKSDNTSPEMAFNADQHMREAYKQFIAPKLQSQTVSPPTSAEIAFHKDN